MQQRLRERLWLNDAAHTQEDRFLALVSLRNALTPTGSLLVVLRTGDVPHDLCDLAERAGFTRVRELSRPAPTFSTLELKR